MGFEILSSGQNAAIVVLSSQLQMIALGLRKTEFTSDQIFLCVWLCVRNHEKMHFVGTSVWVILYHTLSHNWLAEIWLLGPVHINHIFLIRPCADDCCCNSVVECATINTDY